MTADVVQNNVTIVEPAPHEERGWGIYTGRTLGSGGAALILVGGWPGFSVDGFYGILPNVDLGVKIGANYTGLSNYVVNGLTPRYGMDFRLSARISLYATPSFAISAFVEPGWHVPEFIPAVASGPSLVAGLTAGIRVVNGGAVYLGLDLSSYFEVMPDARATTFLSFLPGAGYEMHLAPWLGVGARVNAGPILIFSEPTATTSATAVDLDLIGQAYVVFRLGGKH